MNLWYLSICGNVAITISVRINFEVRFIKRVFNFEKNQRITWNS